MSEPSHWFHGSPCANPEEPLDFSAAGVAHLTPGLLDAFANDPFEPAQHHQGRPSIPSRPTSPSPRRAIDNVGIVDAPLSHRSPDTLEISDEYRNIMQSHISKTSQFALPSRHELSGYISRYFSNFNRHQPLIHEATWSPNEAPVPLVLAVCANGSVYSLEHSDAVELYRGSLSLLATTDSGIWALQTLMLLTAFASWSGNEEDLHTAIRLHGRMTLALRKEWISQVDDPTAQSDWRAWLEAETCRRLVTKPRPFWLRKGALLTGSRVTYCVFTVLNLMDIAFDIPSPISLEAQNGMPCHENQWAAATEHEWIVVSSQVTPQVWLSAPAIVDRLFDRSLPVPTKVGMFGCHVIISLLLQQIILFRRSHYSSRSGFEDTRRGFVQALQRWQEMWESEPESSLSPDNPRGPILFNCTAMLRLAHIRLVSDYSSLRNVFGFLTPDSAFTHELKLPSSPPRTPDTARAVMQATLALYIPAKLGFKVVSRTSFWVWSVQHSLSYFECALLLSQWLQTVEGVDDMSPEEVRIKRMVEDILQYSKPRRSQGKSSSEPLSVAVLLLWAELLDTRDTTVWKIMPKMSRVLERYREIILCGEEKRNALRL